MVLDVPTETNDVLELHRRLHDGVLQLLEFMSVGGWGSLQDPEQYRQLARRAADDLRATVEPPERLGPLSHVLAQIVGEGAVLDPTIAWEIDLDEQCSDLEASVVAPLVFAAREALNNCARHANATTVAIRGAWINDRVVLDIQDDGCGFERSSVTPGFGVRQSIMARVARAGGVARIEGVPRQGTCVHLELDCRRRLTCR